jgi:uncharacterized protein (TIGR02757 family)
MEMLDPVIARNVLSNFKREDRLGLLDVVNLGSKSKVELEVWGLFCSCLAWGGLIGKRNILIPFYKNLPGTFSEFIIDPSQDILRKIYRSDVGSLKLLGLCLSIRDLLENHGYISEFVKESDDVVNAIFKLAHTMRKKLDQHPPYLINQKYNLPRVNFTPPQTDRRKKNTSAMKRFCMYFRWMVRDSEPDFGIWDFFNKKDLYHPIDRHIEKIMKRWRVLPNNMANWLNVERVTEYFKMVEPNDPTKFDYHLVTFGQNFCKKINPLCQTCPIGNRFKCDVER